MDYNKKGDFERFTSFAIESSLLIIVTLIIKVSLLNPQNNLLSWQMCLGTVLSVSLIICIYLIWTKTLVRRIGKWNDILFIGGLTTYTLFLYFISIIGRNSISSLVDYYYMYCAAEEMADGIYSNIWDYYLTYSNNFKPTLYLGILFSLAKNFFKMNDPYYFVLLFSVLQVPSAIIAARYLSGHTKEQRRTNQCIVLGLFMALLPIMGNVQSFYTDSMSFSLAIIFAALFTYATEHFTKNIFSRAAFSAALAGIILAFGITIKVTVLIPCIAGGIVCIFCRKRKYMIQVIIITFVVMSATYVLIESYTNTYAIYQQSHNTAHPISSWIALGLKGNGSWAQNSDFAGAILELTTKEEKVVYTKKYLQENISYLWDINHISQKINCNYASGNLGLKDATYYAYPGNENNIVWELFAPYGKFYWRTSQINFSYLFGIWSLYLLGGVSALISLIKGKVVSKRMLWTDLSIIGLFLFLMIWEANNRQLYNQLPILLLGTIYHLKHITLK